jgi:undecaprenyl-diphosphatase
MPSAHAANFFAVAAFFSFYFRRYRWWFFFTALVVGLSRVFVGVHYPGDVLAGAVLGIVCAYIVIGLHRILENNWDTIKNWLGANRRQS